MIGALRQYLRDEGVPRWRAILLTPETAMALVSIAAVVKFGDQFFSTYPKISDLTTGLIAYASIALGFCVAGLTISLTLPDRKFAIRMATLRVEGRSVNAYSDLLFVFSWTAIAHWFAVMALFGVILFEDGSTPLLSPGYSPLRLWLTASICGLCVYCLCQFLITLITLSQVGNIYIRFLKEHPDQEE